MMIQFDQIQGHTVSCSPRFVHLGSKSVVVELDEKAKISDPNVKCHGGCIYETKDTLQHLPHDPGPSSRPITNMS